MDTDRCPQADNGWRCIASTDVMFLSADVIQMLYGFPSVSNLFNICGLYWSASGRGCGQELP